MTPKVIVLQDQNELVATANFPYAKFPFEKFNPVQSRLCEIYNQDANFLIAASTSSGKTACAEQMLSYEIIKNQSKGMYLSPYKALTQEKIDEWGADSHDFKKLNLAICTGDYRLTNERKKELDESNIILATTEMLDSISRNHKSDKNSFLSDVKVVVVDELQLILEKERGSKIEIALMKLTELNPGVKLAGLSATMPNVKEIAEWFSKLNGKDTYVIQSQYRPCPLQTHYIAYNDAAWKYEQKELEKIDTAIGILTTHFDDKFLIVVHSKKTGELLLKRLRDMKIQAEYHNADLPKDKRLKIENDFRNDPQLRVLVATCGVGTGLNLPARRVIVLGVHSGLNQVETYKINQYKGRAGRPKYDPKGDAYVLLPKKELGEQIERLKHVEHITSQLIDKSGSHKVLAFHIINEINHQYIQTKKDIFTWYSRTLAAHQENNLDHDFIDKMIAALKACGAIKEENGVYTTTAIGKIASLFYFSPFDVSDLNHNFIAMFDNHKELDEYWVAMALANKDSNRTGFVNATEKEQIADFVKKIPTKLTEAFCGKNEFSESVKKAGYCYFCILQGISNPVLGGLTAGLRADYSRLTEVLFSLEAMFKWDQKYYLKKLNKRVSCGADWSLLDLCTMPGIGKVKANKLWNSNVKSLQDIVAKPNVVKIALGLSDKKVQELRESAELMLMADQ